MQTTKQILSLGLAGAIFIGAAATSFAAQHNPEPMKMNANLGERSRRHHRRHERRHHHHVRLSKNMKRVPRAKSLKKESW